MWDDDQRRLPPRQPYQPTSAVLHLPRTAVEATLALLQSAGRRESCVFWYGDRGAPTSLVRAVRAPRQTSNPRNYQVDADDMRALVEDLPTTWRPLAQVHSHPGPNTEHSRYDDEMIATVRALSLVFPSYGAPLTSWPGGVGVHEHQNDYWYHLDPGTAARRVVLVSGEVEVHDFR